jgi:hypothetical protein
MTGLMPIFLQGNGVDTGPNSYHSIMVNGTPLIRRYLPAPVSLNACACSVSFDCPASRGQFFCINGNNCTIGTAVWTTPGMVKSCTHMQGLLNFDLSCFFNQTCLNIVLSLYNYDMPTRLPLPSATLAIPILNGSALMRFSPNDTVGIISNQLMVEEWNIESNFEGYYNICAPSFCSYTYSQRLVVVYVIATITGLIGGLLLAFRIIVPLAVRFVNWLIVSCCSRHADNNEEQSGTVDISAELKLLRWMPWVYVSVFCLLDQQLSARDILFNIKQKFLTMNLFKKETSISQMENVNAFAVIASRFYLIFLICSVLVLILFDGLRQTNIFVTKKSPSLATFEELYNAYPTTISCPCQQIAVPYDTFLSVSVSFHQVSHLRKSYSLSLISTKLYIETIRI